MKPAHRDWYERELGWPTTGGSPPQLRTGVRFDVLDVPAAAGLAALRRLPGTGPVALHAGRALFLVAAGSAEELPGLLEWLDWTGITLDLAVRGEGGRMPAPPPPCRPVDHAGGSPTGTEPRRPVWLRPPERGREVERSLPSLALLGSSAGTGVPGPVGLVPLVGAVATECHRARLMSARGGQPCAFSYASRMLAGTRPRSLTS